MHYTYIVECSDRSFYTGWTTDLHMRLAAHNAGRGARYTRGRRPVRVVYWECFSSRSEAQRREVMIKRQKRSKKEQLIAEFKRRAKASLPCPS